MEENLSDSDKHKNMTSPITVEMKDLQESAGKDDLIGKFY